jgi:hypothetical protein
MPEHSSEFCGTPCLGGTQFEKLCINADVLSVPKREISDN